MLPESDATGASPGRLGSVCPGALSAPVPWPVWVGVSFDRLRNGDGKGGRGVTLSLLLLKFGGWCLTTGCL